VRNQEAALSVVDSDGRYVGLIPPDHLLTVLLSEHEEDLSRLGSFLKGSLAADMVGWFEAQLQHKSPWLFSFPASFTWPIWFTLP
jgi:magnesium transporter